MEGHVVLADVLDRVQEVRHGLLRVELRARLVLLLVALDARLEGVAHLDQVAHQAEAELQEVLELARQVVDLVEVDLRHRLDALDLALELLLQQI